MRNIITVFIIIPLSLFAQNGQFGANTFEILKDKYLYEKLQELDDDKGYDVNLNYDSKDSTVVVINDAFSTGRLTLIADSNNGKLKASMRSYAFKDSNIRNKLYQSFIASHFKVFEEQKLSAISERLDNKTININGVNFYFERGFLFSNLTQWSVPLNLYIGIVVKRLPVFNKKGQIKRTIESKHLYLIRVPEGNPLTDSKIEELENWNLVKSLYMGLRNGILKDKRLFNILPEQSKTIIEGSTESDFIMWGGVYLLPDNISKPESYIDNFEFLLTNFYGDSLTFRKKKITFTSLQDGVIARALEDGVPTEINIEIDSENWAKSNLIQRTFIIYHELGHDAFGIEHNQGVRLMATNTFNFEKPSELGEMIHEMFSYYILEKK